MKCPGLQSSLCSAAFVLCLFPAWLPAQGDGGKPAPDEEAMFDFGEAADGKPKGGGGKETPPEAAALPPEAAALMERHRTAEKAARGQLLERIRQSRRAAAEKLTALAGKSTGEATGEVRAGALKLAELCARHSPEERLAHPAGVSGGLWLAGEWNDPGGAKRHLLPDGSLKYPGYTGTWRWIDPERGFALCDWYGLENAELVRLRPGSKDRADLLSNLDEKRALKKKGADRLLTEDDPDFLVSLAAREEEAWRAAAGSATAARRAQLFAALMVQARTIKGPPGIALLQAAAKMREPLPVSREAPGRAERLAGEWRTKSGERRFAFSPSGEMLENGKPAGSWRWAKYNNHNTALVILEGGKPPEKEVFMARLSGGEEGVLRTYSLDSPPGDLKRAGGG